MGRYTGPKEKLSRREGVDLGLKGARALTEKSAMVRRPYPPGEHGRGRRRDSDFGVRMREKQRAKRLYGLREKQFRRVFDVARKREGVAGENMLVLLERRLDNVVHRLGFASTRAQARQFVGHGHVLVNGRRLDVPSALVGTGDRIEIRKDAGITDLVRANTELGTLIPPWLQGDHDGLRGEVLRDPVRTEIQVPVTEQLVVEYYAR